MYRYKKTKRFLNFIKDRSVILESTKVQFDKPEYSVDSFIDFCDKNKFIPIFVKKWES